MYRSSRSCWAGSMGMAGSVSAGSASASVALARCRALLTETTVVSSSSATSAALQPSTSRKDEDHPLPWGEVLQGGDEGESDALAGHGHLGRVIEHHHRVGNRLDPALA